MFPIMLDLFGQHCLVVGAGRIAYRKLLPLLAQNARVTVVAPTAIQPIEELAADGTITLRRQPFADTDVEGCRLVLAATDDPGVNGQVASAARLRGILVNVADVPELCDFYLSSRVRRGDLDLVIGSGGSAPFVVRRLRELLEERFGPAWADWMAAAKRYRERVRAAGLSAAQADASFDRFFAGTVDGHSLTARVPTEREESAWCGSEAQPQPKVDRQPEMGHVALVGAGPGHPGLITVEGMNRLRSADAIVYDRLSIPTLPLDLPDTVELYPVGKEAGNHTVPQDQINALLLRLGRMGKRVVRLKGGDPFVFARGGEELQVLREAGIPSEAIPGVTAGIAAPAAADIPLTFRGEAVSVTFVTAHEGGPSKVRWDLLAQDTSATLVGYMGVSSLAEVSRALMAGGMSESMPAAVVEQGTLPGQKQVRAPLSEIARIAKQEGIKAPAIFVIGRTVAHAEALASHVRRPLFGRRIALFAPLGELGKALREAGAEVLGVPEPITRAARLILGTAPLAGWIVRTPLELASLERERSTHGLHEDVRLLCVGPDLTDSAREHGWQSVTTLSPDGLLERIGDALES